MTQISCFSNHATKQFRCKNIRFFKTIHKPTRQRTDVSYISVYGGYFNGFNVCSEVDLQTSKNKGSFKIIVEVKNYLPHDTYGGITVSVGNYPQNIFKSDYNIYFPAGQIISKEFTFKSADVLVGAEFEVNLDYGDDYNQYTFGKNTPPKKPEIVQFTIS